MFLELDKYIGRTVFSSILMGIFILTSLSGIIKFSEQLKKVGDGNYTTWSAGIFTLLMIPRDIEVFFPMATLLGVLFGLGILANHSELIAMQAAGFSRLQIAISVIKSSIPLLILTMVTGESIAPLAEQWARNYRAEKIVGQSLMVTDRGVWAKDYNDFIHIQRVINKNEIKEVSIYQFDTQKKLEAVIFAASGHYDHNISQWQLLEVRKLLVKNKRKIINSQIPFMHWKTTLNPEKLGIVLLEPDSLRIIGLYRYIKYLKENGQESLIYELSMWKKILSPLSAVVMILMGLSFIFGSLRSVAMGVRILIGISAGFIFYLLNEGFSNLTLVYNLSPLILAILPTLLFLGFSILLLMR